MSKPIQVADAVRAWNHGDPVTDYCADRIANSILKIEQFAALRNAQQGALAVNADKALQILSTAQNDAISQAAACTAAAQIQLEKLELDYERNLRQTLRLVDQLSRRPTSRPITGPPLTVVPAQFATSKKCAKYLRDWHTDRGASCLSCRAQSHYYIASREKLQCDACDAQWSVRAGTIMAKSRLPLCTWFAAIHAVLIHPKTSSVRLAQHLGDLRVDTARLIRNTIRDAVASPHRSTLLAGLDEIFSPQAAFSAPQNAPTQPSKNLFDAEPIPKTWR